MDQSTEHASNTKGQLLVEGPDAFQKMPAEYRELVTRQMMVHTEGELSGADDYMEIFYLLTEDSYERMVCCERAIEELDHYERGAKVLADIGIDTAFMLATPLQERNLYATEAVKECHDWAERALFSFLGETAVLEILREMSRSSYRPIADMCGPVIKDEQVHVAHGFRITRNMCRTMEGREQIQSALLRRWPITLDLFGKSGSRRSKEYVRWGLRQHTNEQARDHFIAMMLPKLEKLDLKVPEQTANRKFL